MTEKPPLLVKDLPPDQIKPGLLVKGYYTGRIGTVTGYDWETQTVLIEFEDGEIGGFHFSPDRLTDSELEVVRLA